MIKFISSYYKVRELCHNLKDYDQNAINQSAVLLSQYVNHNDIVVPMPSHDGYATYMLDVAWHMANICHCNVKNILSSDSHETWYNTKLKNGINTPLNYHFHVNSTPQLQGNVYIIDNVYSTGKTMQSAISIVKKFFPKCNVIGLVLGYVDQETVEKLHYNENLHEGIGRKAQLSPQNQIYADYCFKYAIQLPRMVMKFLFNPDEGKKLYQPWIRSHGVDKNGKTYLRFERSYDNEQKGKYKILSTSTQLIDFDYLSKLLRIFMFISDKFSSNFEYSDTGKLEYVVRLVDKLRKDSQGNVIISNNHPITKKGEKQVYRFGSINSPIGPYQPHNYNNLQFTPKAKIGRKWNKYFNPEYYVYNANGKVIGYGRSEQTGDGQFPLHWFPKSNKDDITLLSQFLVSAIRSYKNKHSEALFIAFLNCVNSGRINGYEYISSNRINELINICENEINPQPETTLTTYTGYNKPKSYQITNNGRMYDDNGDSSDSDMEYQINNLGLENVIRDVLNKMLM